MKGEYSLMKRNAFIRALCVALCAALLLGTFAGLSASAVGNKTEAVAGVPAEVLAAAAEPAAAQEPSVWAKIVGFMFRTFGFIGFTLDPYQFTVFNQTPTFQLFLGFNDFYDYLPWVVNVWTDTFRCHFNYDGEDWRVQCWKGGYGLFLATGGELGIYNKKETLKVKHFNAPLDDRDKWFQEGTTYTIYNKGEKLFTRPCPPPMDGDVGPWWWMPGYKILSLCTDFLSHPRKNVVMDANLAFKDAEMARLFAEQLAEKGFTLAGGALSPTGTITADQYKVNGNQVHFVWQNISEGIY